MWWHHTAHRENRGGGWQTGRSSEDTAQARIRGAWIWTTDGHYMAIHPGHDPCRDTGVSKQPRLCRTAVRIRVEVQEVCSQVPGISSKDLLHQKVQHREAVIIPQHWSIALPLPLRHGASNHCPRKPLMTQSELGRINPGRAAEAEPELGWEAACTW